MKDQLKQPTEYTIADWLYQENMRILKTNGCEEVNIGEDGLTWSLGGEKYGYKVRKLKK